MYIINIIIKQCGVHKATVYIKQSIKPPTAFIHTWVAEPTHLGGNHRYGTALSSLVHLSCSNFIRLYRSLLGLS